MTYTAAIIRKEVVYLDANTGELLEGLTSEQKLMDAIFNVKYIYAELFTYIASVTAKTQKQLQTEVWNRVEGLNIGYDFEVFIKRLP